MDKAVTELDSPKQQAMYAYLDSMDGDDDFNLDDIPPTKEESNSNKPTIKGLNWRRATCSTSNYQLPFLWIEKSLHKKISCPKYNNNNNSNKMLNNLLNEKIKIRG